MSASRHFSRDISDDQLKSEIKADIAAARGAQRDLQAAGQWARAEQMGAETNEYLDELSDANNGKWRPKHA